MAGINAAIAASAHVIATSVPDASALKGSLQRASSKNIEIITVNSGLGAFDSLPHYMVHVGQTEDVAGQGAGKQFKSAGAKKVLIVIHEASNSGLQQRADGVKKILGSGGVQVLTIPNAKSDIPGTKAKVQAAFKANKSLDGFLGLDPDVTIPCLDVVPKGTKSGTFDVGGAIKEIQAGPDAVRDRPAAVPPGLPAGRLRDALRHEPEHRRERPAGADRARDHQQGERGAGGQARHRGHALDERDGGAGAAAARPGPTGGHDRRARHSDRTARAHRPTSG